VANTSDMQCDVLIVGAGPAGAAAARSLAQNGYRALILDRKKLPRYKICSGLVIGRSQEFIEEHFGPMPDKVFCEPKTLKGFRFCMAEDSMVEPPIEKAQSCNVWRSEFDYWLIQQSGAEIIDESELIDFEQTEQGVRARIRNKKRETFHIEASYLIGADGANSRVRKLLDPAFVEKIRWFIPLQLYCIGTINLEREYFYAFLDRSFSAFYAWVNFKDDYLVYGVAAEKGDRTEPYLKRFTEYLENYFQLKIEKVVRKTSCLGADLGLKGNFLLGRERVLLVGEAAGFMNMFGEGISSALPTGFIAGDAIHKASTSDESAISIYTTLAEPEKKMTTATWELAKSFMGKDF